MKSYNCIDFYLYLRHDNRMRNNNISQRLKTLRKNSGKSQAQIAELNGTVTQPAILVRGHAVCRGLQGRRFARFKYFCYICPNF